MRISDWSSDVCSSDLGRITVFQDLPVRVRCHAGDGAELPGTDVQCVERWKLERTQIWIGFYRRVSRVTRKDSLTTAEFRVDANIGVAIETARSEEHTSELQSLMRISYAVFCLKNKTPSTN